VDLMFYYAVAGLFSVFLTCCSGVFRVDLTCCYVVAGLFSVFF